MNSLQDKRQALDNAKAELMRADHLLYVSLKYTRTVDVLKNLLSRLIAAYDFLFQTILMHDQEQGMIEDIPALPILKLEEVKKLHPDDETIKQYAEFYILLKKLNKAPFEREREFRRHVKMIATINDKTAEVSIDIISDYYARTKEFLNYVAQMIA